MPATVVVGELGSRSCVALCRHCARQRDAGGCELEGLAVAVVSGCCHDCGGGFCLCRGSFPCELCPRRNAPVILEALAVFALVVPPPPSTLPSPLGGE